jgi:hypothetical protein
MRLVVTRYEKDRATLSCNYANGAAGGSRCTDGGGGASAGGIGARRGAPPSSTPASTPEIVPLSPARLARLKRFDLDWQAALGRVDASRLSPAARPDLLHLPTSGR